MNVEFLEDLNTAQKEAVVQTDGPGLVVAGAGSGKTRVLTYRIAYLLQHNVSPWSVLSLTFTNKAAREMKNRIAALIGEDKARSIWMGTFHSIFSRILRAEAPFLNYPSNFTIYDTVDQRSLIKSIIRELGLDDKVYKPSEIAGRISSAKNNLITAKAYASNNDLRRVDEAARRREIFNIYQIYARRCFNAGAMDFDDLLLQTNLLFRDFPEVLQKYQEKFKYILVDEYQDTNLSQYYIIKKLSEKYKNICVVGDDAQSIYSFRGAKIENILNFKNDYKDYKLFKLEQNYRSTQTIVNAANSLIEKNTRQIPKTIFSRNETGNKIKVIIAQTDSEEGFLVINDIQDSIMANRLEYKDFAILYRTNAQSRIFEESLRRKNIPYKIFGGMSFYQRKEIKDILAYLKIIVNQKDDESLKRIINYPKRGIGSTTLQKVESAATVRDLSMWDVINSAGVLDEVLNKATISKLKNFAQFIKSYIRAAETMSAYVLVKELVQATGIISDLNQDKTPEGISRRENVQELLNGIREFTDQDGIGEQEMTLSNYLQEVALLTSEDIEDEGEFNKVTLMTVHSSKGLEFNNLFVVGLEEELFPSAMSMSTVNELEEERRLFYVAMTRAMKNLTISYAKTRYKWGNLSFSTPSRFLREINPEYVNFSSSEHKTKLNNFSGKTQQHFGAPNKNSILHQGRKLRNVNPNKISKPPQTKISTLKDTGEYKNFQSDVVNIGTIIEHQRFGEGKVVKIEGDSPDAKITVKFNGSGLKQLLLKFAKFKIVKE